MKRSLFFVLAVLVLVVTSCAAPAAAPTQAPQQTGTEKVKLTFSAWGAPEELAVWKEIVNDFQAKYPNITVNVEVGDWDAYWDKVKTQLAANTAPDVFAMDAPLYLDYQTRGVLLNLQTFIDAEPDMMKDIYPQTLEAYKTPDGYFGLPRDFNTIVLFYNKDMFDQAKVAYPTADWTWDDLRDAAKKLTLDTNGDGKIDQYGYTFDQWDMEPGWSEALWSYGGEILSADYSKTLLGEPKAREAWQMLYDMVFVDKSCPDANQVAELGGDPFTAGKAAMNAMGHWAVPGYVGAGFQFDAAPMPKGPAGHATSVNSAGFVVAKTTKYPKESFEFIKFVLSPDAQGKLAKLGFAVPVLKSVAESDVFLKQEGSTLNQQVFLDSLAFAHMKPVFRGYDEWAAAVGDGLAPVWSGEAELNPTLDEVVKAADAVLAKVK